jgi:hypothetical protein
LCHLFIWVDTCRDNCPNVAFRRCHTFLKKQLIENNQTYILHDMKLCTWYFTVWSHWYLGFSILPYRAHTTLKSEGEVRDNREKWWEYREKSKYFSTCTTSHSRCVGFFCIYLSYLMFCHFIYMYMWLVWNITDVEINLIIQFYLLLFIGQ